MDGWKDTGESKACVRRVCDPENQQEPVPLGQEPEGNYGRDWHDVLDLSSWWPGQVKTKSTCLFAGKHTSSLVGRTKYGVGGEGKRERGGKKERERKREY